MKIENLSNLYRIGLYSGKLADVTESFENGHAIYRFSVGSLRFKLISSSALILIDGLLVSVYASPNSDSGSELTALGLINRDSCKIVNEEDILQKIVILSKTSFAVMIVQLTLACSLAFSLASAIPSGSIPYYLAALTLASAFVVVTLELLKLIKSKIELKSALELLTLSTKDIT